MANVFIAVAIGLVTVYLAYLGVRVTIHPAETEKEKLWYKAQFGACGIIVCVLVGVQTHRSDKAYAFLEGQLARIEKNTKEAPTVDVTPTINIPPAKVIIANQVEKEKSSNTQSDETALTVDYWGVIDTSGNVLTGPTPLDRYEFYAIVNASKMPSSMRIEFDMAILCGFADLNIDSYKDTRITVSQLFRWQDHVEITAPINDALEDALMEKWRDAAKQELLTIPALTTVQATAQIWIRVILLSKGFNVSSIHKLQDVPSSGGKISEAGVSMTISKPFRVVDLLK